MDIKQVTMTFESGGKQLTIGSDTLYGITYVEGLEASDVTISMTPIAQYDGSTVSKVRIEPRPIHIEVEYPAASDTEEIRHWLQSFFVPKNEGKLSVNYCGTERKINYYCSRLKDNRVNIFSPLAFAVDLTCPDPWFYDAEEHESNMVQTVPLLTFPFNSVQSVGITTGTTWRSEETEIHNTGDTEIGIVVEVVANGPMADPYIMLGTQRVQAQCSLQANDVVEFSTVPLKKGISLNGVGNIKYYRDSEFFSVPIGTSTLQVGAASGGANATATIRYSFKYMGV